MCIMNYMINEKKKGKKEEKKSGQKSGFNNYGTPEGTFPFRYLSEKKLKQGN